MAVCDAMLRRRGVLMLVVPCLNLMCHARAGLEGES